MLRFDDMNSAIYMLYEGCSLASIANVVDNSVSINFYRSIVLQVSLMQYIYSVQPSFVFTSLLTHKVNGCSHSDQHAGNVIFKVLPYPLRHTYTIYNKKKQAFQIVLISNIQANLIDWVQVTHQFHSHFQFYCAV